jgi:quinol monooxygenase YgiN
MFCSVSVIRCAPESLDAYLDLRRREIDPRMAAAPGFMRRTVLRSLDSEDELLLIVHWASREDALAYRRGTVHADLRRQALALLKEPLRTRDYESLGGDG